LDGCELYIGADSSGRGLIKVTYLLTPGSRVLLEKLTGLQLVKKFLAFYGTRMFITAFTSARHLSLSRATSIHFKTPTSYFLKMHFNIILPSKPVSPKWSLSLRFPNQNPVYASPLLHTQYMPRPSHSSRLYHPKLNVLYRNLSRGIGRENLRVVGIPVGIRTWQSHEYKSEAL